MGPLVEGVWPAETLRVRSKDGRFVRPETQFRNFISADGSTGFRAEAGRYHLYVSLACPGAHRTLIFRALRGLEGAISVSVVDPFMGNQGWVFGDSEGCIADPLFDAQHMHEIYTQAGRNIPVGLRYRYCGIRRAPPSSTMNRRKLSA